MAFARVFGAAGWGVIAGPLIGSQVLARTKSVRSVYATAGLIAGALTLRNSMAIPETLATEKRRAFKGFVNPFAFLKLFSFNPSMTKMVLAAVFPSFAEGKNLHDIQMLWMRNDVKLTTEALGTFITVWGIACTFSGMRLVPMLMKTLGSRAYTTLANAGNAANYALVSTLPKLSGVSQQALLYFALLLLLPGINGNNSSGCKGWAQSFAARSGLAPGEYAGYFANARALTTMLAPFVYGRIYENCQKRNVRPTIIWVIAAILGSLAPELLWRSIPASEMPDAPKPPVKEKPDSKSA